jgi:hypothetical protein
MTLNVGTSLLRRLQNAVPGRTTHVSEFLEFSNSLPADSVLEWTGMVEKWEKNIKEVNPFVITAPSK